MLARVPSSIDGVRADIAYLISPRTKVRRFGSSPGTDHVKTTKGAGSSPRLSLSPVEFIIPAANQIPPAVGAYLRLRRATVAAIRPRAGTTNAKVPGSGTVIAFPFNWKRFPTLLVE